MRKFLITVALFASTVLVSVGVALPASATTSACRNGPYAPLCGTMVDRESFPIAFDAKGQSAANNTPIVGYPNLNGDAGTDFVRFPYRGGPQVIFIYAPYGQITNMCIADPAGGYSGNPGGPFGLILRACNGSVYQRFSQTTVGPGAVVLTSLADGRIVQSNGQGVSLTTVPRPATLTNGNVWSFTN
jgi:hypothetical protein